MTESHLAAQKISDDSLVLRSLEGDSAAFETLVCRYRQLVIRQTRRITGTVEDAEDMAQQAFMKPLINLPTFRFQCSFSTWLVSIAINEARMWTRRHRRSREVPMADTVSEDGSPVIHDCADGHPDPETLCVQKESHELLWSELERLSPTTRAAIEGCDLQQLSMTETALMLGLTVAAVKSRRSRGPAALRRRLESHLSHQYA